MKRAIHYIKFLANADIVMALSTPITVENYPETVLEERNNTVIKHNNSVKKIALEFSLTVDDLYSPMLNHPEYRSNDGVHYLEFGKKSQATQVAKIL